MFFFFQAEDGIRDYKVTGVQTCALPISRARALQQAHQDGLRLVVGGVAGGDARGPDLAADTLERGVAGPPALRLESVPGRPPTHHDPLDVTRHPETRAESAHAVGFRVGLG